MAQQLDIIIKVKQVGDQVIKGLLENIKKLREELAKSDLAKPLEEVSNKAERVAAAFEKTKDSVAGIEDTIAAVVTTFARQTRDIAGTAVGRIGVELEKSIETGITRSTVLITAFTAMVYTTLAPALASGASGLSIALHATSATLTAVTAQITDVFSLGGQIVQTFRAVGVFLDRGVVSLIGINGLLASTFGLVGTVVVGISGFFIFRTVLSEGRILLRRLIGQGTEALTPLERATRFITTIDQGLNQIGVTGGQVLKVLSFGVLTFINPILGVIPLINSSITILQNTGRRLRLGVLEFFGSARARFLKILLDAQGVLSQIIPAFANMRTEAEGAGKALERATSPRNIEPFTALTRTKLPFAQQFQLALIEFRAFITELLTKITELTKTIQKTSGLTKSEIAEIAKESKAATDQVAKGVESKTKIFLKGPATIAKALKAVIRSPFTLYEASINLAIRGTKRFGSAITGFIGSSLRKVASISGKITGFLFAPKITKETTLQKRPATATDKAAIAQTRQGQAVTQTNQALVEQSRILPAVNSGLERMATTATRAATATVALGTATQTATTTGVSLKVVTGAASAIKVIFGQIFKFQGKLEVLPEGVAGLAQAVGNFVVSLKAGNKVFGTFESALISVGQILTRTNEKFKTSADGAKIIGQTFGLALQSFSSTKILTAFKPIETALQNLVRKGKIAGNDFGSQLSSLLSKSLRSNDTEIIAAANHAADLISAFFPSSPPKRGPLRRIGRSGVELIRLLAAGMVRGVSFISRAMTFVASAILNPLKALPDAFGKASGFFGSTIKRAANIKFLADRIGTTTERLQAFDFAISSVGGSLQDLTLIFPRLNTALNEGLADPKKRQAFADLGIDLEKIKKKGDPALALFLAISDVIKSVPPGSKKAADALKLISVVGTNKVINLMRLGSKQIQGLLRDSVKLGVAFDHGFSGFAQRVGAQLSIFSKVFGSIKRDFLAGILPILTSLNEKLISLLRNNRIRIQVFFAIVGQLINILFNGIIKIYTFIVQNPARAIEILRKLIVSFFGFVLNVIKQFQNVAATLVIVFVTGIIPRIGELIWSKAVTVLVFVYKKIVQSTVFKFGTALYGFIARGLASLGFFIIGFAGAFVPKFFNFFTARVVIFVKKFVVEVLIGFIQAVRQSKYAKVLAKIPGFGFLTKSVNIVGPLLQQIKALDTQAAKLKGGDIIAESYNVALSSANEAAEYVADSFKTVSKKAKDYFVTAEKDAQDFIKGFRADDVGKFAEKQIAVFVQNVKKLVDEVSGIVSDTPIPDIFEKMQLAVSDENIEKLSLQYQKMHEATAKGIDQITADTGDSTADMINKMIADYDKINESAEKTRKKFLALIEVISRTATQASSNIKQMIDNMVEFSGKKNKKLLIAQKAAAIADILINSAVAIVKAFSTLGPIGGPVAAASIAALTGTQIAKVVAQKYATGGEVAGPGGTDNVPAMLTAGEYVIPRGSVQYYGMQLLDGLRGKLINRESINNFANNIKSPVHVPKVAFAAGGPVLPPRQQADKSQQAQQINIANFVDPNLFQQFLATSEGEGMIMNVLTRNRYEVKTLMST